MNDWEKLQKQRSQIERDRHALLLVCLGIWLAIVVILYYVFTR